MKKKRNQLRGVTTVVTRSKQVPNHCSTGLLGKIGCEPLTLCCISPSIRLSYLMRINREEYAEHFAQFGNYYLVTIAMVIACYLVEKGGEFSLEDVPTEGGRSSCVHENR